MSTNPFDDESGSFYVLVNAEGQHSLWPTFAPVPAGWTTAHGAASRTSCLEYVEANWADLRPASLIARMDADRRAAASQATATSTTSTSTSPAARGSHESLDAGVAR